jgi:hypothetical protein
MPDCNNEPTEVRRCLIVLFQTQLKLKMKLTLRNVKVVQTDLTKTAKLVLPK